MSTTKILAKIRKLLALAGNNPSQEEAQAAALKAQELLAEHGLSMAEVEATGGKKPNPKTTGVDLPKVQYWQVRVGQVIAENFRCNLLIRPNAGVTLIGMPDDVTVAAETLTWLIAAARALRRKFRTERKRESQMSRPEMAAVMNDYMDGFVKGLSERFAKQVKSMALVLVKDALVESYTEKISRGSWKGGGNQSRAGDGRAYERGREDAKGAGTQVKSKKSA